MTVSTRLTRGKILLLSGTSVCALLAGEGALRAIDLAPPPAPVPFLADIYEPAPDLATRSKSWCEPRTSTRADRRA